MKEKIKEKVLDRLAILVQKRLHDKRRKWMLGTVETIEISIEETSKHFENKIKELEKEIERLRTTKGIHHIDLESKEEIKQLKSKLKQQRKKIEDRIDEWIIKLKEYGFHRDKSDVRRTIQFLEDLKKEALLQSKDSKK